MKSSLLILTILLSLLSCKKQDKTEYKVSGIVTDESFQKPLAGATIVLYQKKLGEFDFSQLSSTESDVNGNYKFSFNRDKVVEYKIVVGKEKYFDQEFQLLPQNLTTGKDNTFNLSTSAFSWVKIHLQNTGTVNSFDDFLYRKTGGKTDCTTCCQNTDQHFYGAVDTTFYCLSEGNKPFSYYYELSNTTTLGNKQGTTIAFDTISLETTY